MQVSLRIDIRAVYIRRSQSGIFLSLHRPSYAARHRKEFIMPPSSDSELVMRSHLSDNLSNIYHQAILKAKAVDLGHKVVGKAEHHQRQRSLSSNVFHYSLGLLRGTLRIDDEFAPGLLVALLSLGPLLGADMADFRDQGVGPEPT